MKITITSKQLTYIPGGVFPLVKDCLAIARGCDFCGEPFCTRRPTQAKYCGDKCRNMVWESNRLKGCRGCGKPGVYRRRVADNNKGYCGKCKPGLIKATCPRPKKVREAGISDLYFNQEYPKIIDYLHSRSNTDNDSGCWEWNYVDKNGYGRIKVKRNRQQKTLSVHRLALEAKLGRPFVEHAHHKCSNTLCCNPDHLELATANENIAEMLARQSYIARIEELEAQVNSLTR